MWVQVPPGALYNFFICFFYLVLQEAMKRAHADIPPKTLFGEPLQAYVAPKKPLQRIGLYGDRETKHSDTPRIMEADDDENARDALPRRRRDGASDAEEEEEDDDSESGIGSLPIPVLMRSESIDLVAWAAAQNRPHSPHPITHRPLPTNDLHLDPIPENT